MDILEDLHPKLKVSLLNRSKLRINISFNLKSNFNKGARYIKGENLSSNTMIYGRIYIYQDNKLIFKKPWTENKITSIHKDKEILPGESILLDVDAPISEFSSNTELKVVVSFVEDIDSIYDSLYLEDIIAENI